MKGSICDNLTASIRLAALDDVDEILAIQHASYDPDLWESKETFLKILACQQSWVATGHEQHILAYALCHRAATPPMFNTAPEEVPGTAPFFIHDLAVHPDHRNLGISGQLIKHIPCPCMLLSLPNTVRFWKSHEFTQVPQPLDDHVNASYGGHMVWMEKKR